MLRLVWTSLSDKVIFEQRPQRSEGVYDLDIWGIICIFGRRLPQA